VLFAFYGVLGGLLLYPLLFHINTHGAGYDYFHFHWNFWWIETALFDSNLKLYQSNYVITPFYQNLAYHTLAVFWYPLWAILSPLVGMTAAVNLIIWLGATLNGWMMALWLRANRAAWWAALVGGVGLMALPTMRYFYYNTHLNLMAWFWIPALLWLWQRLVACVAQQRFWRALGAALMMGVCMWLVLLTDSQLPLYAALLLSVYGVYTLITFKMRWAQLALGTLALSVAVVLGWLAGPLSYLLAWEGSLPATESSGRPGVPFPEGFLTVMDGWWHWNMPSLGALPLVVLLVGGIGWWRYRRAQRGLVLCWLVAMILPFIFALGGTLYVGNTEIALPYRTLFQLTDGNLIMPWRFAPAFVIAVMTFAATTVGAARWRWWSGALGLWLVLILTRAFWTAPTLEHVPPDYDFYARIGQEPATENFAVLEVPTAVATGQIIIGDPRAVIYQRYAIQHHRRVLNGFIARAPLEYYWYLRTDDPLLSWLGSRRDLEPTAARNRLIEVVDQWPVGYVVVHQAAIGRESATNQQIIGFLNEQADLLCPLWIEKDAIVWRSRSHWLWEACPPRTPPFDAEGHYRLDIGGDEDVRYILSGWYWAEQLPGIDARWIGAEAQAGIVVDLPPADYTVRIVAQAYQVPRQLSLMVNDRVLGEGAIQPDGLSTLMVTLPADVIGDGRALQLALVADATLPAPGERDLSVLIESITFIAQ